MRCHFRDPELQRRIERDGFVVVPLLTPADRAELRSVYESLDLPGHRPFGATLVGRSFQENDAIADRLEAVVVPRISAVLDDWSMIGGTFLVKEPHPESGLTVHQDWSSVDERTSVSMNVWCAIDDVPLDAGPLEVLPGSHLWFRAHRAPLIPSVQIDFSPLVDRALRPLPLAGGEAVIYDHRLFHGSRANTAPTARVATQIGIAPLGAPLVMTVPGPDGTVELRQVDEQDFFRGLDYEEHGSSEPIGTLIDRVPADPLGAQQVVERIVAEWPLVASSADT